MLPGLPPRAGSRHAALKPLLLAKWRQQWEERLSFIWSAVPTPEMALELLLKVEEVLFVNCNKTLLTRSEFMWSSWLLASPQTPDGDWLSGTSSVIRELGLSAPPVTSGEGRRDGGYTNSPWFHRSGLCGEPLQHLKGLDPERLSGRGAGGVLRRWPGEQEDPPPPQAPCLAAPAWPFLSCALYNQAGHCLPDSRLLQ